MHTWEWIELLMLIIAVTNGQILSGHPINQLIRSQLVHYSLKRSWVSIEDRRIESKREKRSDRE
jgi:hypothetical protein